MLTKEAYEALTEHHAITAADDALDGAVTLGSGMVALPNQFTVHDLEKAMPYRRRPRGAMVTSVLADFKAYVEEHQSSAGAAVFVDKSRMVANAVLNLGNVETPGHADDTAQLALQMTAAYKALQAIVREATSQTKAAEFLEDWAANIACNYGTEDDEEPQDDVPGTRQAVAAVRRITIESARKVESEQKNLSATASTFDQVKVANAVKLPTRILFRCSAYLGLAERSFAMRLSVLTGEATPKLQLRVINQEKHDEEMAEELANLVRGALGNVPVHIGSYAPGK